MLNTKYVSVRDVQRNYKEIGEEVSKTNTPTIVMRNQEPQFVIISMEMFDMMQQTFPKASAKHLLQVVEGIEELNLPVSHPSDLSQNLNKYTWD
jgi:prevent-host-death family protein